MTAPTLSIPVKVLRSATAGRRPGDGTYRSLTDGELFLNTVDLVLCYLNASGTLITIPFSALAQLASPAFTGSPTAPTQTPGDASTKLATTGFVATALSNLVASAPGALDTLNELATALNDDPAFATTMATALAARVRTDAAQGLTGLQKSQARVNVSSAPFEGLAYQNMAVNPRHVISQFNGNNSVAAVNNYVTDGFSVGTNGITLSAQRVASPFSTRPDLLYGLQATVTTASGSLAAGSFAIINQPIEGSRIARLLFGTANARKLVVGMMLKSSIAGTFYVSLRNGAGTRSYANKVILAANTDTFVSMIIPGDTSGAWATDATVGMNVIIGLVVGSTYQTTAATWQGATYFGGSDQTNWAATAGNTFVMSDLIVLPSIDGITDPTTFFPVDRLPLFQRQDDEELRICKRYWRTTTVYARGSASGGSQLFDGAATWEDMRTMPSATLITAPNASNVSGYTFTPGSPGSGRFEMLSSGAGDTYALAATYGLDARL